MLSINSHRIIACCVAVILVFGIFVTYYGFRQEETTQQPIIKAKTAADAVPTRIQVYEDEAFLKNSMAVVGGTVENISDHPVVNLNIEIELNERDSNKTVKRIIEVTPRNLLPNQKGRYSLLVPSRLWSNARLVRLFESSTVVDLGFKAVPGARRPPEPPPRTVTVTQQAKRPAASQARKDEFINTPETPITLR